MQHSAREPMKPSRDELVQILAERAPTEMLNLLGFDLSGLELTDLQFERVIFGVHPLVGEPTKLVRTSFRGSRFISCLFAHADLDRTDFRGCELLECDFRYATLSKVQLADARIRLTDFYRATFCEGTVMAHLHLELVSLTAGNLESDLLIRLWQEERDLRAVT